MNVKQLKEELSKYPDTMDVFVDVRLTEFRYGLLNSAKVKLIDFMEDPDSKPLASEDVVVLSED